MCDFLDFTKDFHNYSKYINKLSDIRFMREVQFLCLQQESTLTKFGVDRIDNKRFISEKIYGLSEPGMKTLTMVSSPRQGVPHRPISAWNLRDFRRFDVQTFLTICIPNYFFVFESFLVRFFSFDRCEIASSFKKTSTSIIVKIHVRSLPNNDC